MKISAYGITDTGKVRPVNEDALLVDEKGGLFAVADGMGGHNCGDLASRMAVSILQDSVSRAIARGEVFGTLERGLSREANLLGSAIRLANRTIHEAACSRAEWSGMGTTVAAVLAGQGAVAIAHVGDSRVYLLREGELKQLTADHSLVAEQLRSGLITQEEAQLSPRRNIITRALGHAADVQVDLSDLTVRDGDRLLICSDGLSSMLTDLEIKALILARTTLEAACRDLVEQANAVGGRDNVSVLLMGVQLKSGLMSSVRQMFNR